MSDPRPRHADEGMTLPELIISITILAFIVGAIGFALVVALRSSQQNQDRVSAGGGAQLLSAWFTSDVQSSSPVDAPSTDPDTATGCPGADPGANGNILLLHRSDSASNVVSYRLVEIDGDEQIWRVWCIDGVRSHNVVAFGVAEPPPHGEFDTGAATGQVVAARLSATIGRRVPVPVLVSGTLRTRTTDDAPLPCTLVTAVPQTLVVDGAGALVAQVIVDLYISGSCGTVRAQIPTGGSPAMLDLPAAQSALDFHEVRLETSSASWAPSGGTPRVATVTSDGATIGSFPVSVVRQPCSVRSASPSVVELGPPDSRLASATTYTVVTRGPCTQVSVRIPTGGSPSPLTANLAQTGSDTWATTLTPAAATWSVATGVIVDISAGSSAALVGRALLDVRNKPCTFAGATPTVGRTDSSGRLSGAVTMTITTSGFCTHPALSIGTGGSPNPFSATNLGPGPLSWTVIIPRAGQTWSEGDHVATFTDDSGPIATFNFRTEEGCSKIGTSPGTVVLNGAGRLAQPTLFRVTTRGNCTAVTLTAPTGGAPNPLAIALAGPSPWTATVNPLDATWSVGVHPVTITLTDNIGLITTDTFDVTATQPGCVVSLANPHTTQLLVSNTNRVVNGERISFSTTGPCGATLTVRFTPPTGSLESEPATETTPGTWRTGDLGGIRWRDGQSTTVYVYASTTTFDQTTLAGEWQVDGQ